jgi:hypothetical protein
MNGVVFDQRNSDQLPNETKNAIRAWMAQFWVIVFEIPKLEYAVALALRHQSYGYTIRIPSLRGQSQRIVVVFRTY